MRKKILVIGLIFTLFITTIIFNGVLSANEKVFALEDNKQFVVVIGNGKVETVPDNVQIGFGITIIEDSLQEGHEKISQIYDNISTKIKELDASSNVFVNYSYTMPVCEHGIQKYEFNYDVSVKSKNLDNADKFMQIASKNGATSFSNIIYTLENQKEIYNNALLQARDNAIEKANALYSDTNLKELIEISVYSYSEGSKDGKIIVEAKVKARFELNNDIVENNTNDSTSKEDTTNIDLPNDNLTSENDNLLPEDDFDNNIDNNGELNNQEDNSLIEEQTFEENEKDKLFGLSF